MNSPLNYKIKSGLSSFQVIQLTKNTLNDTQIKKYTSDLERFGNLDKFRVWAKKPRIIYTFQDTKGNLKGIIWFSTKEEAEKAGYAPAGNCKGLN